MLSIWQNAGVFLISVVFDLYIFVLLLRFFLQLVSADFYNPLTQFAIKITKPVIAPLQHIFPTFNRCDFAVIVAIIVLQVLKLWGLSFMQDVLLPGVPGLFIWAIGGLFQQVLNLFFYAILLQSILSWVRTPQMFAMLEVLYRLTNPLMHPVRRLVPSVGGIDVSPIPLMIILKLLEIVVSIPIMEIGQSLAFGH